MRKFLLVVGLALWASIVSARAEDLFKGKPPEGVFTFGVAAGIAPMGASGGLVPIGNVGAKIVNTGFVPDINNQVWVEIGGGVHVAFNGGLVSGLFSTHLRWDFIVNDEWTLFAAAGAGGYVTTVAGSTTFVMFPRVAIGAVYYFVPQVGLRLDLSHEWTTVGLQVRLP